MLTPEQSSYAREAIANIAGHPEVECDEATLSRVFEELSCAREIGGEKDTLGRWVHADGSDAVSSPWIDEAAVKLRRGSEPVWPEGRPFALCLTHDVDMVSHMSYVRKFGRRLLKSVTATGPRRSAFTDALGCIYRLFTETGRPDPLGRYEDWLKVEDECGFRSTFYFVAPNIKPQHAFDPDYKLSDPVIYDGRRMTAAEMMREMDAAGFEIGLHGSIESATRPGLLAEQKRQIEDALGHEIRSTRQHYLTFDATLTHRLQSEAGFTSDSTLGFNRSPGFRGGTSFPYRSWDHSAGRPFSMIQIPLTIMDITLTHLGPEQALERCIGLMDAVERVGGCLTLNWHPNYIGGWMWDVYKEVIREAANRGAWGRGAGEIADWWEARMQRIREKRTAA